MYHLPVSAEPLASDAAKGLDYAATCWRLCERSVKLIRVDGEEVVTAPRNDHRRRLYSSWKNFKSCSLSSFVSRTNTPPARSRARRGPPVR